MGYIEKYKSKKQKWLEISLALVVLILLIGGLIVNNINTNVSTDNSTQTQQQGVDEESKYPYVKYIIGIVVLYWLFGKKNVISNVKTDEEIIDFVADEIYKTKGIYLNTKFGNVKTQNGAPNETYVEFINEHMTYLYLDKVGIIERYTGETIRDVKNSKQEDKIQMKLAEIGIANKKHIDKLEEYGLTEEVQ